MHLTFLGYRQCIKDLMKPTCEEATQKGFELYFMRWYTNNAFYMVNCCKNKRDLDFCRLAGARTSLATISGQLQPVKVFIHCDQLRGYVLRKQNMDVLVHSRFANCKKIVKEKDRPSY